GRSRGPDHRRTQVRIAVLHHDASIGALPLSRALSHFRVSDIGARPRPQAHKSTRNVAPAPPTDARSSRAARLIEQRAVARHPIFVSSPGHAAPREACEVDREYGET